jgi:hypothetical protein
MSQETARKEIVISYRSLTLTAVFVGIVLLAFAAGRFSSAGAQTTMTATEYMTESTTLLQTSTAISSSSFTVTQSETSTVTVPPSYPYSGYNMQVYCGYPFNPATCNEGPPTTVTGYLTNDTSCVDLYADGQNYVVWNLPQTYPDGPYQVYGFVYPNWPATQPFPPNPFQTTLCEGTPIWAIPPYIQAGT